MKNTKTKHAFVVSALSMLLCVAMLMGTTLAWFTDSASTGVNKIQAGNLDIEIVDMGEDPITELEWVTADDREQTDILWEPGATYKLEPFKIKNKGSLALKFKFEITGIVGDAKLLEAIDFTYTDDNDQTFDVTTEHTLNAGDATAPITITGHMRQEAGNEYQGLSIEGIRITVLAKQATVETDSFDNRYDLNAEYPVAVKGIAGFEGKTFKTMQEAYDAIQPKVAALAGLDQNTATNDEFDAVFTDGGRITWYIVGRQEITSPLMLSFGRAAAYYNPERWLNDFRVVGASGNAEVVFTNNVTLPRNWWTYEADPIAITFENVALTENAGNQITIGQANAYDININILNSTVNGNIYLYHNNTLNVNIRNTVFNAKTGDSYALMMQGDHPGKVVIDGCTFSGYSRGVNFERKQTDFVLTNSAFRSTSSEPDRGVIQLTDGKSFVVNGNTVNVTGGNAFWFHSAATNADVTYEIKNNNISAPYLANTDASFNVNSKITSSGNSFNSTDTVNCMEKGATTATASAVTAIK